MKQRLVIGGVAAVLVTAALVMALVVPFVLGDAIGDALLVAGHRFKAAGTPIRSDGTVSLVTARAVQFAAAQECGETRDALRSYVRTSQMVRR